MDTCYFVSHGVFTLNSSMINSVSSIHACCSAFVRLCEAGELNALPRYLPERSFAGCKSMSKTMQFALSLLQLHPCHVDPSGPI